MTEACCTTEGHASCPNCGQSGREVKGLTLLHQLKYPLNTDLGEGPWYHCTRADCDISYYSLPGRRWHTADMRQHKALACYCFGISEPQLQQQGDAVVAFVSEQTRAKQCACEQRNPSGRCCLKDIKNVLK